MSSIDCNRVVLTGRLGHEPQLKSSTGGVAYVRLSVGVSCRQPKVEGESRKTATQWQQVVVWGQQAEQCSRYLHKGSSVLVEGHLDSHSYENQNGKKHIVQIVAERVKFLSGRGPRSVDGVEAQLDDHAAVVDSDLSMAV